MRYTVTMDEVFRTGYGRDWLDFATTYVGRYTSSPVDLIATPAQLHAWLTQWGLAPSGSVTATDVEDARALREALHRLGRAAATDAATELSDVRVVDESLSYDAPVRLRKGREGLTRSRPATTREALARLARLAVDDLSGPNAARLRACGDDECSGIFLDPTGRRRWCSDERCGVKVRVRAHRARARAQAQSPAQSPAQTD
jgi:predicted RNA-binding Zn ribbon-like protein